jgi:hypothetical protein
MEGRIPPRLQGDLGEHSAIGWLLTKGFSIYLPYGHSPHCDLMAEDGPTVLRVQVKTSTVVFKNRWVVAVCTKGGNQSWSGLVKRLDPSRIDYLFAHVADGRRWFIPSGAIGGGTAIHLGGPRYAEFEVEPGAPLPFREAA